MPLLDRLGLLPAVPVVAAVYAATAVVGLALDDRLAMPFGVALLVLLVTYCAARPAGGLDIFLMAAFPAAMSSIVSDIAGVARWWLWLAAVPFALLWIAQEDRPEEPRRSRRAT